MLVQNSSTEDVEGQPSMRSHWQQKGKGKAGNGGKKLKLSEFPCAARRTLQKAREFMTVKLVTENAFPSNETRILWANECYSLACGEEFEGFLSNPGVFFVLQSDAHF